MFIFKVVLLTLTIQEIVGTKLSEGSLSNIAIVSSDENDTRSASREHFDSNSSIQKTPAEMPFQSNSTEELDSYDEDQENSNEDASPSESKERQFTAMFNEQDKASLHDLVSLSSSHHYWTRKRGREPEATENYWAYEPYYYPRVPPRVPSPWNRIPLQKKKRNAMAPLNGTSDTTQRDSDITNRIGQPTPRQLLETKSSIPAEDSLKASLPQTTERRKQKNLPKPLSPKL